MVIAPPDEALASTRAVPMVAVEGDLQADVQWWELPSLLSRCELWMRGLSFVELRGRRCLGQAVRWLRTWSGDGGKAVFTAAVIAVALAVVVAVMAAAWVASPAAAATAANNGATAVPIAKGATFIAGGGLSTLSANDIGYLYGISCPSSNLCYAAGATPPNAVTTGTAAIVVTLRHERGGWEITAATSDWDNLSQLNSISCSDATHCAAVGVGDGYPEAELTSDGNGSDWSEVAQPTVNTKTPLLSVSCVDRSCMAVGSAETQSSKAVRITNQVWVTDANRPHGFPGIPDWVAAKVPKAGVELNGVDCTSPGNCWVVGSYPGAWHTADNGRSWSAATLPDRPPGCKSTAATCYYPLWDLLETVQFQGPNVGYIGGGSMCGAGQVFHCSGVVLRTTDGGANWAPVAGYSNNIPFVDQLACAASVGGPCVGTAHEYGGSTSGNGGLVGSAEVASGNGQNWSSGPWHKGAFWWAAACPASGTCLMTGAPLTGTRQGFGGIYLAQGVLGAAPVVSSRASSISSSLPTPQQALGQVGSDVAGAAITLGVALFITFPANLFNATFEENYADILAWWSKWAAIIMPLTLRRRLRDGYHSARDHVLAKLPLAASSPEKAREGEHTDFVVVLLAGALLGSMLDPAFGLNWRTVLSYIAIALAMTAGVVITGITAWGYHRAAKHGNVPYKLQALPAGLAVAVVCVIISRASGFTPGYLYGVICGVAFGRELAKDQEGHLVAIGTAFKVVLAILAWLAWDAVTDHATHQGGFFGRVLLDDFLASLFVSSLVGTVISLFPLRFLPGHKLRSWHQGVWAGTVFVTLFVLVQVLLRPHGGSSAHGQAPLVTTVAMFVLFAAGSLAFRDHFARKRKRQETVAEAAGAAELPPDEERGPGGPLEAQAPPH